MSRQIKIAAVIFFAAGVVADAQESQMRAADATHHHAVRGRIAANGRCKGISYGTGARSCGTRTGGPVGGISGRN